MAAESGMAPPSFGGDSGLAPVLRRGACLGHGIDWSSFDRLLHALEPTPAQLQLRRLDDAIDPLRYVEAGAADGRWQLVKEQLYTLLRGGARMLLPQVERSLLEARQLSAAIGRRHGAPTSAGAFLTFAASAGSPAQWLTEDCEILQLIGRQRWLVYGRGFEDPLPGQDSAALSPLCPTVPLLDVVLETGDVLEIPRGWWHRSLAFDAPSAQLIVQIQRPSLHDYLGWALASHAPARAALRRRLVDAPAQAAADLGAAVEALRELLLEPALLADYRRARALAERPQPEFELAWLSGQRALRPDTPLRLATSQAPVRGNEALLVNGCALPADGVAAGLVRELAQQPWTTVGALAAARPGLSPEALQEALLELSAHGLLVIGGARLD